MEWPAVHAAARRPANHDGRGSVPQIMTLGDKIRDLVERANDKVDELHFANGPQADVAQPAGGSDDGALADRLVNHALPAKPFQQALTCLKRSAVHADVLAHQ